MAAQTARRLVILIPAFNEAETIEQLLRSLPDRVDGIDEIVPVVIDDGSTDGTGDIAENSGAQVVCHRRNMGIASAFRSAIRTALELRATVAVSIDADLQFSPEEIPALVRPILAGEADFVAGNRFHDGIRPRNMPRVKYYGNKLLARLTTVIADAHFHDVSSGYRAYSREALLNLNVQSSFTYTQETFIELMAKELSIAQVPVQVTYFPGRQSRVVRSVFRYGLRTFLTIARTTRDYAPLTVFGVGSLIFLIPGIGLGIFIGTHYLITGSFSPYIFVAFSAAYLFTAGAALFVLGLVADMLRGIRANQERLLYFAKRREYALDGKDDGEP